MNCQDSLLTSAIREQAQRLGFFKVGVARARPLPAPERFDAWLNSGMHGEMGYLERQAARRRDPALLFKDARSLIVLAMDYYRGSSFADDPLKGRISRYAWGDDYHQLMMDRLNRLHEFIRHKRPEARSLCCVDTGPVMEKVWGAETSLGWMGKHSNLMTRDRGSWIFLGVVLLNLGLDHDAAEKDYCGTCTRCMTACPTGAIVAPYVVDARRCISYLTIELRSAIPRALRPLIGNRIFGCDDCQEVCPWNKFSLSCAEPRFTPRAGNQLPDLIPLASMTAGEFETRFRGSAVRRAKRDGFVRNVVVALGNARRPEAVGALTRALGDPSPLVRSHAAWSLAQVSREEADKALRAARATEKAPEVIEEINIALEGS